MAFSILTMSFLGNAKLCEPRAIKLDRITLHSILPARPWGGKPGVCAAVAGMTIGLAFDERGPSPARAFAKPLRLAIDGVGIVAVDDDAFKP